MKFRSCTNELKFIMLFILIAGLLCYGLIKINYVNLDTITDTTVIITAITLLLLVYIYYGLTNYDFELTDREFVIKNRFPLFKKNISITLDKIEKIKLRDDSIINLFSEYKFIVIEIVESNTKRRSLKFHCHGLEYDCNGENKNLPTFDDFNQHLKNHNIITEWIK